MAEQYTYVVAVGQFVKDVCGRTDGTVHIERCNSEKTFSEITKGCYNAYFVTLDGTPLKLRITKEAVKTLNAGGKSLLLLPLDCDYRIKGHLKTECSRGTGILSTYVEVIYIEKIKWHEGNKA